METGILKVSILSFHLYDIAYLMVLIALFILYFSLKTGFLKWKPDYDSAATEYSKAGMYCKHTSASF